MTARPWRESCDWCGWPLVQPSEAGCWDGNCSMRPPPLLTPSQEEVVALKQEVRKLERDLAAAMATIERAIDECLQSGTKVEDAVRRVDAAFDRAVSSVLLDEINAAIGAINAGHYERAVDILRETRPLCVHQVNREVTDAMAERFCEIVKWHPDGGSSSVVGGQWHALTFREIARGYIRAALEASQFVAGKKS